jgi:colanic acid/amylovoran biosynthesis glycosyltransferase
LHVIRCTISDDFLSERHEVDPDSRKLVCIGRLTGQKGQLFLIDAIGDLVAEGIDVNLTLAGDGEMRQIIEEPFFTPHQAFSTSNSSMRIGLVFE